MKVYSANEIRNVAVLGHSRCGKTALMEAVLHASSVTSRMGRVEDGNTVSDYDADEIRRTVSIGASLIPIEWLDNKINFLDTPGYFDFAGSVKEALAENPKSVAEYKEGNQKVQVFFMGIIMRKTGGKADPAKVNEILRKLLEES